MDLGKEVGTGRDTRRTMNADREQFLTPHEVAELLMVSPVTVRQWAQKGMLPALTTAGGHRRFRWDDVERFAREKGMQIPDRTTTVLVVDDDRQLNNYLVALLSTSVDDVDVISAYDGFEAGKLVQQARPDIVLLDVMMPGMDGVQVCRSIMSDANTAHARVVGMTGHHSAPLEQRMLDAGAIVLLRKPFATGELLQHCGLIPAVTGLDAVKLPS